MKLPRRFSLKGKTWVVILKKDLRDDEGNRVHGLTDFDLKIIYLDTDLKEPKKERIFWHEYCHALLWESGVTGNTGGLIDIVEEIICDSFADALTVDKEVRFKRVRR